KVLKSRSTIPLSSASPREAQASLLCDRNGGGSMSATETALAGAGFLPKRPRGRPSPKATLLFEERVADFCDLILKIRSTMDFDIGGRGWCYILERHGLRKGDFDAAQRLINDCRKSGGLPLDICQED